MTPHTPTPSTVAAARMIDGALRHELLNLLSDDRVEAIAKIIDRHSAAPALVEALEEAFTAMTSVTVKSRHDGAMLQQAARKAAAALAAAKPN
jgi:hypothetical protein